jgi:hypothetical protein
VRLSALLEAVDGGLIAVTPLAEASHPSTVGPDPEVRAVVTTDLLDPGRYLGGGELVLTGLAWWRPNRPDLTRRFVRALTTARVCALAAGEAALGRVPEDLVEACAQAGLPLLRVPVEVSFASITEIATQHLSAQRSGDLAAVLSRHRLLVAAATAEDPTASGLGEVLALAADTLDLRCWVLSVTGRLICGVPPLPDERERTMLARRFLRAPRLPHRVSRPGGRTVSLLGPDTDRCASFVLAIADDHSGWTSSRRRVADELLAIVALERDRTLRRSDPERELSATLVRQAPPEQIAAAARRCGLDLSEPAVVVVGIGLHAATVISEALAAASSPSVVGPVGDEVFAVATTDDPSSVVSSVREAVALVAPALGPHSLQVGVSDAVRGADCLLVAVEEARAAGRAADGGGPHRVGGPDRLSSHALLLAAVPDELRRAYRTRVLGPLLEHDHRHRTDLVSTLHAYLDCSGSWSRCAAQLHVHVNTLRYRIERIEELTGKDLRRLEDQTDLLLALRVT